MNAMGRPSGKPHPHLAKLRKLVASLPEGVEVEAWEHPTFRAGKRMFAAYGGYEDFPSISIKQTLPDQAVLVQDPRFHLPKYVAKQGWVGIDCTRVSWSMVEDLAIRGYRLVALKRMLAALDSK